VADHEHRLGVGGRGGVRDEPDAETRTAHTRRRGLIPPGGHAGSRHAAGVQDAQCRFVAAECFNSNTHAGPGPDVGTNRDGRTNAKTQESSDLDAETEWSKHNKGLLDDPGLD